MCQDVVQYRYYRNMIPGSTWYVLCTWHIQYIYIPPGIVMFSCMYAWSKASLTSSLVCCSCCSCSPCSCSCSCSCSHSLLFFVAQGACVLSTRRHRAHPVSVPILPPREILVQALWSQNHHETMQWHVIVLVRCWLLALLFFVLLRYDTWHTGMNIISLHSRIYTKDLLCCSRCMCSSHLSTGRHPAHPVSALILHLTAHVEKFCGLYTTTPSFCKGSRQRNAMPSCGCCWPFRF